MVAIVISEKGGPPQRQEIEKAEISIGRNSDNDLVLPKGNVSKRHARIVVKDGKCIIVDLNSTNGTFVNGRKIQSPQVIKTPDKVYIGDFIISAIMPEGELGATAEPPPPPPPEPPAVELPPLPPPQVQTVQPMTPAPPSLRSRPATLDPAPFPDPGLAPASFDAGSLFDKAPEPPPSGLELSFDEPGSIFDGPPERGGGLGLPPGRDPLLPPAVAPGPSGPSSPGAASALPGPAVASLPSIPPVQPASMPAGASLLGGGAASAAPPVGPGGLSGAAGLGLGSSAAAFGGVSASSGLGANVGATLTSQPAVRDLPPPGLAATAAPRAAVPSAPVVMPVEQPPGPAWVGGASPTALPVGVGSGGEGPKSAPAPGRPMPPARPRTLGPPPPRPVEGGLGRDLEQRQKVLGNLMERLNPILIELEQERLSWEAFRERTENALYEVIKQLRVPPGLDKEELIQDALNEATALGPLEEILMDETVRAVMVNDPRHIYVSRGAELERMNKVFSDEAALEMIIQRLLEDTGVRLDSANPSVDVRRKDGIRVTALLPPIAVRGPALTVRRSQLEPLAMDDLLAYETVSGQMVEFLEACVIAGKNILVAGGSGAGKTTLLNCLATCIPSDERIITIEDGCELVLPQENVIALESRPASQAQAGIGSGELVNLALRMHPDRLLLGDMNGADALELLRAMTSGSAGVMTCVNALDAQSTLERLETMCLMSGKDLPVRTVRELVATGVELLVILTRFASGERRVTSILEVTGLDVDVVNLEEIFRFEVDGTKPDGAIVGHFRATGFVPRIFEELQRRGQAPTADIFR